jgi:hypothetical protein
MKRHTSKILCLLFVMVTTNMAQDGGNTYRIEFDAGKDTKHLKGSVDLMNPNLYVFPVRAAQRIKLDLKGEVFSFVCTHQACWHRRPLKDVRRVNEVAQEAGEYRVLVRCYAPRSLKYRLDISVK